MSSLFQIVIYRNKFWAYLGFIVTIGLTLGILTCAILINQWIGSTRIEAANAFSRIENNFQNDADRIEAYMQRIYSNDDLMNDAQYFMSDTMDGYLTNRLKNSSYHPQGLISFPEDIKTYLYNWAQGDITQISVHTEHYSNVIRFNSNGIPSYKFAVPNSDELFQDSIQKGFIYHKKLTQTANGTGELRFQISSERIFNTARNYQLGRATALNAGGNEYMIGHDTPLPQSVVQFAVSNRNTHGYVMEKGLTPVFYVIFSSSKFNYKFISTVDLRVLIRQHLNVLLNVFFIAFAAMISVLVLVVYNLRDDARFLHRIIQTIKRVKTADFTPNRPAHYRRNEYGMIAREVDDMMQQLDKHIRNEYLLKLKQQEAEMKALQNQINPHFLYNTLEVIRSTAHVNQDTHTADAIATLGALYRDIVRKESIISIESELELLQRYLEIMEFKYPDQFYYQLNVDEALLSLPTVKLWMQPLAENFFVHGFDTNREFNLFVVSGWEEEHCYRIDFIDNGCNIDEEKLVYIKKVLSSNQEISSKSIGLYNVYARLKFYYHDNFSIQIENIEESGVKISIQISKEVI